MPAFSGGANNALGEKVRAAITAEVISQLRTVLSFRLRDAIQNRTRFWQKVHHRGTALTVHARYRRYREAADVGNLAAVARTVEIDP
jgi:hypothetical protein